MFASLKNVCPSDFSMLHLQQHETHLPPERPVPTAEELICSLHVGCAKVIYNLVAPVQGLRGYKQFFLGMCGMDMPGERSGTLKKA
jgi:hypothetical protein